MFSVSLRRLKCLFYSTMTLVAPISFLQQHLKAFCEVVSMHSVQEHIENKALTRCVRPELLIRVFLRAGQ